MASRLLAARLLLLSTNSGTTTTRLLASQSSQSSSSSHFLNAHNDATSWDMTTTPTPSPTPTPTPIPTTTPTPVAKKTSRSTHSNSNNINNNNKPSSVTSGSRERLTSLSYFYGDADIDKAGERPLVRLNPLTMMYMGVSGDNSHLLQSAVYLRNELPIRLAHMLKEFRLLPFIVACHPSMLDIQERIIRTFRSFDKFDKEIRDIGTEKRFNQLVFEMLEMNKDLLSLLCDGFKDTRRYIRDEHFIKTHLNRILAARLGIRLLCEHHIALNKQSNLNRLLLANDASDEYQPTAAAASDSNDKGEPGSNDDIDHLSSAYMAATDLSAATTAPTVAVQHNPTLVGIMNRKFSPKRLVETSARMVTRLCLDRYGVAPKIKIDGHTRAQFPYLPLPLEYIVPELLKNAFRATCEHHYHQKHTSGNGDNATPNLPDVNITIAVNEKDFVIRIRDRGGGIPHHLVDKIFDYHFTTANGGGGASARVMGAQDLFGMNNSGEGGDAGGDVMNMAMGVICEASSSQGLAVMHGYGFGLPTSKAYAEYLGGSLTFQSMQGIGSDFYLRLGRLDVEPEMVRI